MERTYLSLVMAAAMLAAVPAAAEEQPKRGGTLIYAVNAEPPTYDCQGTTTFAAIQTLNPSYSQLLKFDPDNYPNLKTDVAESYTVAPDNLSVTFRLKSGIKFHDGSPFTSEDVRATFDRIRKPPEGVVSVRQAAFEDVASIETPDPLTVVFKLSAPSASMLMTLASPWNCLYSAAKLRGDIHYPERNVLGTGPFRFESHVRGSHWTGMRFDGYFEPGKPYLDGFRVQFMTGAPMVNALQGGQIHAEFRGITPAERDRLKAALGDKIVMTESPWLCKFDVFFNSEKPPYNDPRVRKALSLAIDRWKGAEALSRTAFVRAVGLTIRPGHPLAITEQELKALPGFGPDGAAGKAEAKRLLKEAGAENLKFKMLNRNVPMPFTPVAIYLVDQWRQIGVTAENNQLDVAQQKSTFLAGNFEVGLDATCTDTDEPNAELQLYISSDRSPINFSRYHDQAMDDLFEKQKRVTSDAERKPLLRQFERRLIDQSYTVPIVWWHRIVAHSAALKGWKITPSHYLNQDLAGVWLAN
ncbi:MAG: ABC transporter substrate-binding protein [Proteobacteria bacterium]|nr:ABC transporter substrate-binding protein [Pseudomonadota bacterium]MBI3499247.1 ABC transporter substrate-binding protein [Pseudomonadota bacterium]